MPHPNKVHNERLKLTASFINSGAVAIIALALLRPAFDETQSISLAGSILGIVAHLVAWVMLIELKDEKQ